MKIHRPNEQGEAGAQNSPEEMHDASDWPNSERPTVAPARLNRTGAKGKRVSKDPLGEGELDSSSAGVSSESPKAARPSGIRPSAIQNTGNPSMSSHLASPPPPSPDQTCEVKRVGLIAMVKLLGWALSCRPSSRVSAVHRTISLKRECPTTGTARLKRPMLPRRLTRGRRRRRTTGRKYATVQRREILIRVTDAAGIPVRLVPPCAIRLCVATGAARSELAKRAGRPATARSKMDVKRTHKRARRTVVHAAPRARLEKSAARGSAPRSVQASSRYAVDPVWTRTRRLRTAERATTFATRRKEALPFAISGSATTRAPQRRDTVRRETRVKKRVSSRAVQPARFALAQKMETARRPATRANAS